MFEIIENSTRIDGVDIAYTECGPEDGHPLFCAHGLLSNGRDYDALALKLAEQGYRVICMDLPGRGRSGWFADKTLYAPPHYVPFCLGLIGALAWDNAFDWLGVSLGGMLGMAIAPMQGVKMQRLILVDIGPEIPGAALDEVAAFAKAPTLYESKDQAVSFLKTRCAAWGLTREEQWNHLIAHNIIAQPDGRFRLHYDPAIGATLSTENETLAFWELWAQIKQPTLLLRGGQSKILPESVAQRMAQDHTGASFTQRVYPQCGHVPSLMEDAQIDDVAAWLKATTPPA